MCVGVPAVVVRIDDDEAYVDAGDGRLRKAGLAAPERVRRGDYILLYGDLIVAKTDRRSALESLRMQREMAMRSAEEDGRDPVEARQPIDLRIRRLSHYFPTRRGQAAVGTAPKRLGRVSRTIPVL